MRSLTKKIEVAEILALALAATVALAPSLARAESASGVAGSGMSQGSGAITTRSDVEMSVEGLRGTSRARLGAVGQAVGAKLGSIRGCYKQVTSQRPTKEGSLQIEVRVPEGGGRAKVEVALDEVGDPELRRCVVKAIESADLSSVRGPAGGMVVVEFANTAAEGARLLAEQGGKAIASVSHDAEGRPQATAKAVGGQVAVHIRGQGNTTDEAVGAFHQVVQARIGRLLDARRRAARREMNPAGVIELTFSVSRSGVGRGRRISSTVEDTGAHQRVLVALRQALRGQRAAAGRYRLSVTFAGN